MATMAANHKDRGKDVGNGEAWSDIMENEVNQGAGNQGGRFGRDRGAVKKSWAEMLGSNLPATLNKNILEIVLEKDERGSFNVGEIDCAKVMGKLGIDPRPGVHVEGVQICPNGRGVILITLKEGIPIDGFCRFDVLDITSSGIRSVMVKPSGKREVIAKFRGIHPNTRDNGVMDYLAEFAKVVSRKVVYGVFGEGPLRGLRNGDRSYKIEVSPKMNIGTYHVIDGQRVTLRYPGQQQTCAHCLQTAQECPGRGMARKCDLAGGPKVDLIDYIRDLWKQIGYSPSEVELSDDINEDLDNDVAVKQQEGGNFTPLKPATDDSEKYGGVSIKTFPKETDHGVIVDFLIQSGLGPNNIDNVVIKDNGKVTIRGLENAVCKALIESIHHKVNFGRKLYCNGIIPMTPVKPSDTDGAASLPAMGPPAALSPIKSPSPASQDTDQQSTKASEIVNTSSAAASNQQPKKAQPMMSEVRDTHSEFGSCVSSSNSSSGDSDTEDFIEKKKGGWESKRKRRGKSLTPSKEHFLKKQNTAVSPKQSSQ